MPNIEVGRDVGAIEHSAPAETLTLHRHRLVLLLERFANQQRPSLRFEHVMIPLSMLVGIVFTLVTAEFKPSLGFSKETWEAFALLLVVATGIATATLLVAWLRVRRGFNQVSPEEEVAKLIAEMAEERRRANRGRRG